MPRTRLLGLLFLLAKEKYTTGYVEVSVQAGNLFHATQMPVSSQYQVAQIRQQVSQAQTLAAGEVPEFTEAVDEARRGALFRMVEHAKALGGNAVVGVRFDSNSLGENAVLAEFVAYGSAIVVKSG